MRTCAGCPKGGWNKNFCLRPWLHTPLHNGPRRPETLLSKAYTRQDYLTATPFTSRFINRGSRKRSTHQSRALPVCSPRQAT